MSVRSWFAVVPVTATTCLERDGGNASFSFSAKIVGLAMVLSLLALAPTRAAVTDYDGTWRLDGTCTASFAGPKYPAIAFWTNIFVLNGAATGGEQYIASGSKQAHDNWSGSIQNGVLALVDNGENDRSQRWARNLSGRAASSGEIPFAGDFSQWVGTEWVKSRTCTGTMRIVKPSPFSVAGKEHPQPNQPPPAIASAVPTTIQQRQQADATQISARQQAEAAQIVARQQAEAARRAAQSSSGTPEVRVALVVGNGAYVNADPLRNPANDAHALAAVLRQIGFDVIEGVDLGRLALEEKIREFARRALRARVALLFYSGHGMQVDGKNYLIPVDAKLAEATDLNFETVEIDRTLDLLADPRRTTIILLDACRDNPMARRFVSHLPLTRSAGAPSGLAAYSAVGTGTLIAYATAPGQTALDGQGSNSPFTTSLLRHLPEPGLEIRQLLTRVRADVAAATGNKQIPWDNSSLMGDVYLTK